MAEPELSAELLALLQEFARSGLRELHLRRGDFEVYLSQDSSSATPAVVQRTIASAPSAPLAPVPVTPAAPAPVAAASSPSAVPADAIIVRAPNLGTFYRSPKPGAPAYVEVGSTVGVGDELCLIEVMKLFTSVTAKEAGRIHSVLVEDGEMVEADQPLFAIVRL